jgi:hypothetical protein
MTVDNWGLKKLFHFDDKHWKVTNDTDKVVTIKSRDGQDIPVKPGDTVHINSDNYSIVLPNNNTVRFSDKQNLKEEDFWENFNVIIGHLMRRLKDGHVIDGLDFLDYHYKWTKNKSRFLTFIKHYVLTVSWLPSEQKDKPSMFIDAIRDWVDEKEKLRRRPIHIAVLVFPLIVYVACWILSPNYKEIFIGALIGGLAAPLKEVYDLMTD